VLYRTAERDFKPLRNSTPYEVEKDAFSKVGFEPVKTNALKTEIVLQQRWSAGVQEVVVE
jgi:hypothetical protein